MCRFPIELVKTWLVEEEEDSVVCRPCFLFFQQTESDVLQRNGILPQVRCEQGVLLLLRLCLRVVPYFKTSPVWAQSCLAAGRQGRGSSWRGGADAGLGRRKGGLRAAPALGALAVGLGARG